MRKLGAEPWPRWLGSITSADADDPRPFLVPGVRVKFGKITRSMKRRAQAEAAALLGVVAEDAVRDPLDMADAGDAYSQSLIRQGIVEWEGIGDADGNVLPVSPEAVELFFAEEELFDAADQEYVIPEVRRDLEKNGLSASLNGTGGAEMLASGTATSPADTPATPGANQTRKPARKGARTSKRSRAPTKARKSGTS